MEYILPHDFKSKIKYDFDLSKITWFQTGGKANAYCHVYNDKDLKVILKQTPIQVPIFVLGAGSNVLIRDKGFRGIVIKLGKNFNKIILKNNKLIVGAAVLDNSLSKFALKNSIKNFEFYSGIPGTIGGAIKMNAGCYGSETRNIVHGVFVINRLGEEKFLKLSDLNFKYRFSSIQKDLIVKEVIFNAIIGDLSKIKSKMEKIINKRRFDQPLKVKTGGSTFKNPEGSFAAKLIEESDCKGMKIGGAIVSSKHANFLINDNKASANDIEILGEKIKEKVFNKFGISLDWEIKIIGERG